MTALQRVFPFMAWIRELASTATLRADIIAGVTVALVLVPQSMAYAQLAGLPPYYGLYASFLPPMVAALFGSSRQLATGPVAVVSLMTAAALQPLAATGSEGYLAYAVLLAFLVGVFQFALGALRLGVLVDFLSHPVVLGFTNAGAIIIATSQLGKLFGVSAPKAEHHYETVWNTILAAVNGTHWPTVGMAVLAIGTMVLLRRYRPKLPNVLIAVVITTLLSWGLGFQQTVHLSSDEVGARVAAAEVRRLVDNQLELAHEIQTLSGRLAERKARLAELREQYGPSDERALGALHEVDTLKLRLERRSQSQRENLKELQGVEFRAQPAGAGDDPPVFHLEGAVPEGVSTPDQVWHVQDIGHDGSMLFRTGGKVVGTIPEGLPAFSLPAFDMDVILELMIAAVTISLIGFMEAISIAKAMAARTRQRLDANRELMGQGLSNIAAGVFSAYPVSGSFSRSAVNINAGALTGFSSVVTGLVVAVTLLWLTPLLYHLPQATLAAVIIMAVINLVRFEPIRHAWKAQPHDGVVAVVTFVLTLVMAPHLDRGILTGVGLSLGLFVWRSMRPRIAILSRYADGTLRDAELNNLRLCDNIAVLRFDGSLYFANTGYFEHCILDRVASKPDLRYVIIDAEGINQIDATGEEMLSQLDQRLQSLGIELLIARLKKQGLDTLRRTGFMERVGQGRFFPRVQAALEHAWSNLEEGHKAECPLAVTKPWEGGAAAEKPAG